MCNRVFNIDNKSKNLSDVVNVPHSRDCGVTFSSSACCGGRSWVRNSAEQRVINKDVKMLKDLQSKSFVYKMFDEKKSCILHIERFDRRYIKIIPSGESRPFRLSVDVPPF